MTIEEILTAKEGENFEFKTAENRFSYTELQKYACAISNEGGGKIVFGITDKRPRQIKGSKAFDQPERTRKGLTDEASKELLCQHMRNESNRGLRLTEFSQVLPSYSTRKIQRLLNALKSEGKVSVEGLTRAARWYLTNMD